MINTHSYGTHNNSCLVLNCNVCGNGTKNKKPFDLDAFHREQMRTVMNKVDELHHKVKYLMRQVGILKGAMKELLEERIDNESA